MTFDEFMDMTLEAFPNAEVGTDFDGQLIVYTNYQFLTSADNPSIPAGEHIIQEFPA